MHLPTGDPELVILWPPLAFSAPTRPPALRARRRPADEGSGPPFGGTAVAALMTNDDSRISFQCVSLHLGQIHDPGVSGSFRAHLCTDARQRETTGTNSSPVDSAF